MSGRGENQSRKDKSASKAAGSSKRGYVKPVLKEYGHLSKLTQKAGSGTDGGMTPCL
jgi:hypothetical protein